MFGERFSWREREDGMLEMEVCFDSLLLLWLSYRFRIDLRVLLFLYQKFGVEVLFFFYLFAGRRVKFPSVQALLNTVKSLQKYLAEGESAIGVVCDFLRKLGVGKGDKLVLDLDDRRFFVFGRDGIYENECA